jgi:hypothetical protein
MYIAAAACMWALRGWKILQNEAATAEGTDAAGIVSRKVHFGEIWVKSLKWANV